MVLMSLRQLCNRTEMPHGIRSVEFHSGEPGVQSASPAPLAPLRRSSGTARRKRCVREVVYGDDGVCRADRSGLATKCCFHRRGVSSATLLAG